MPAIPENECNFTVGADGKPVCGGMNCSETDISHLTNLAREGREKCPYYGWQDDGVRCEGVCRLRDYFVQERRRELKFHF